MNRIQTLRGAATVLAIAMLTMGAGNDCGGNAERVPTHQSGTACKVSQLGKKAVDDKGRELVCRHEKKLGPGQWWLVPND